MNHTGLGKEVCIEAHIEISFGLDIYHSVNSFIETAKEVIMKNSNAILHFVVACVWCGAAFLRSLVEKNSNLSERWLCEQIHSFQERTWKVRFLPSAPFQTMLGANAR